MAQICSLQESLLEQGIGFGVNILYVFSDKWNSYRKL